MSNLKLVASNSLSELDKIRIDLNSKDNELAIMTSKYNQLNKEMKELGKIGYKSLEEKNEQYRKENATLQKDLGIANTTIEWVKRNYKLELENAILKNDNKVIKQLKEVNKQLSMSNRGLSGVEGRITKANEREYKAYEREDKAVRSLNTAVLTIKDKERLVNELTETLNNTKELLVKAETTIDMQKETISMIVEQKELLEHILKDTSLVKRINDKVDSIGLSDGWYIDKLFKTETDAVKIIDILIRMLTLDSSIKGGKTTLALETGYSSLQSFNSSMSRYSRSGLTDIIKIYVDNGLKITDDLIKASKEPKYSNIEIDKVISLLERHK